MPGLALSAAGPLPGYQKRPWRQVTAAANSIAAAGATPVTVLLQGILPVTYEEPVLREDMKKFFTEAGENGLNFCDASIQVSDQVISPQYYVTCIGKNDLGQEGSSAPGPVSCGLVHSRKASESANTSLQRQRMLQAGQELIMTRRIALAGTAALAAAHEEELLRRFPFRLVERAKSFDQWMPIIGTARLVDRFGSCPMHCLGQGGIFNALWEMADQAQVGLDVDLRRIALEQETVEICEYFDINPYYLYSEGALLIGSDPNQTEILVQVLHGAGIPADVIGRVTDKNDRIIRNGENRRFLDRPKQDELWRFRNDFLT